MLISQSQSQCCSRLTGSFQDPRLIVVIHTTQFCKYYKLKPHEILLSNAPVVSWLLVGVLIAEHALCETLDNSLDWMDHDGHHWVDHRVHLSHQKFAKCLTFVKYTPLKAPTQHNKLLQYPHIVHIVICGVVDRVGQHVQDQNLQYAAEAGHQTIGQDLKQDLVKMPLSLLTLTFFKQSFPWLRDGKLTASTCLYPQLRRGRGEARGGHNTMLVRQVPVGIHASTQLSETQKIYICAR